MLRLIEWFPYELANGAGGYRWSKVVELDMATTVGNGPTIQKGDGGWPSMVEWQLHDRERDDNDSLITTTNRAFGGKPIYILFYGHW